MMAGLFSHVMLADALPSDASLLIPPEYNSAAVIFVLAVYTTCGIAAVRLLWTGRLYRASAWIIAAVSLPLAYHVSTFPDAWALSLTGIAFGLVQMQILRNGLDGRAVSAPVASKNTMNAEWVDVIILLSVVCLVTVLIIQGHHLVNSPAGTVSGLLVILLTVGASLAYEVDNYSFMRHRIPRVSHLLLIGALLVFFVPWLRWAALPLVALRQLTTSLRLWLDKKGGNQLWRYLTTRPPVLLVGGFAAAILIGTTLLALPAADTHGVGLSAINALFTATSATCVTGLIVVDTGSDLTFFGQIVVLTLIQAGGLGIMTISTFAALLLGRSIGLREESALKETVTESSSRGALRLVKFIVGAAVVIEFAGMIWLTFQWLPSESWSQRFYGAAFHSISAFCNAGFSLYPDSLMRFSSVRPGVPLGISLLVILGGIGFSVLFCMLAMRRRQFPQAVHVKMVLLTTGILLGLGTLLIAFLEWGHAFANESTGLAILHAWFQSVTARTAGFNTVDIAGLSRVSQVVLMALMFIGGAPGSTAGGIKVTTFAVLILLIRSVLMGRAHVIFRGRRIETLTVLTAAALAVLSVLAVGLAASTLLLTHPEIATQDLVFETVSAFGTVGLSTGITGALNPFGKLIITLLMFLGRLGPLTVLLLMRPIRPPGYDYPDANVMIG